MPPKPTTQKGNRRVTINQVLTSSKTTSKKKTNGRSTETVNQSHRSAANGSDVDDEQEEEEDAFDESQDPNSSTELKRFFNEKLSKRSKNQSAKFVELEETVKELFREARESSEQRKKVCNAMLENVLSGFDQMEQMALEPDATQTVHRMAVRSKVASKAATIHEVAIGPINEGSKGATQEVDENLADHALLREWSRKRLMKYAAKECKHGLEAHKFATDANAYIRHYRKLIML